MAGQNQKKIYKITVNSWDKHNKGKKVGHRYILLHCGFLSHPIISSLTPVTRLLYLSCLLVAGESASSHIEVTHESLWRQSGVKSGSIESQLDLLQSFQLLTYEKKESLYIKEENIKEYKRKELISTEPTLSLSVEPEKPKQEFIIFKISANKEINLKKDLLMSWIDTYPKEFVEEELKKARSWILSNEHKAPKSAWGRFFNSWLSRGWDNYRKTLKSNPTKLTEESLSEILNGVL